MKKFYTAILLIIVSLHSRSQTCVAATAPNLVIKNPAYITGTGTGAGTLNAQYRFPNVTNVTPATTDVIVTVTSIVNASLTSIDDDASNPGTANNFQPVVTVNANSTGYIEFNFAFVITGTTTPFSQTCINFTAVDIDGETNAKEQVSVFDATTFALGNPTNLTTTLAGNVFTITSNFTTCNGICTNPENVCNFGKINASSVKFRYGVVNTNAVAKTRYGSFQFAPYNIPLGGGGPLPLKFGGLNANLAGNTVKLSWSTYQEINLKYFEIERSEDGSLFTLVNTVVAANNINGGTYYGTDHPMNNSGYIYYRIKAVDFDGTIHLSAIVKVSMDGNKGNGVRIFPSPVKDQASISFSAAKNEANRIIVMNALGKIELENSITVKAGFNVLPVNTISQLMAGTYFMKIISEDGSSKIVRFIKL